MGKRRRQDLGLRIDRPALEEEVRLTEEKVADVLRALPGVLSAEKK